MMDLSKLHFEREGRYEYYVKDFQGNLIASLNFYKNSSGKYEAEFSYCLNENDPETIEYSTGKPFNDCALGFLEPAPELVKYLEHEAEQLLMAFNCVHPSDFNSLLNTAKVEVVDSALDILKITFEGGVTVQAPANFYDSKELEEALRILLGEYRAKKNEDQEEY